MSTEKIQPRKSSVFELDYWTCCICNEGFRGEGNNPEPVNQDKHKQCCDDCNDETVIPARIMNLLLTGGQF